MTSTAVIPTAATDKNNDNSDDRLENTTVCLPIIHGSVAFYLGKKLAVEFETHQWTLYIRGPNNEDLSSCISKVVFQLHPSFAQPVRELTSPPYEVCEKGWGEFEAQIRIVWKDGSEEQSTVMNHGIKLYPPPEPGQEVPAVPTLTEPDVPVVSEEYDEVVFTNPKESFFQQLQAVAAAPPLQYTQQDHFPKYSDIEGMQALVEAQKFLQEELATAKQRFSLAQADLQAVEQALAKANAAASESRPASSTAKQQHALPSNKNVSKSGNANRSSSGGKTKKSSSGLGNPSKKAKTSSSTTATAAAASSKGSSAPKPAPVLPTTASANAAAAAAAIQPQVQKGQQAQQLPPTAK